MDLYVSRHSAHRKIPLEPCVRRDGSRPRKLGSILPKEREICIIVKHALGNRIRSIMDLLDQFHDSPVEIWYEYDLLKMSSVVAAALARSYIYSPHLANDGRKPNPHAIVGMRPSC
jgi:hypothetical protein